MKRKTPLRATRRRKATRTRLRPKNPARAAQAFARAYGGEDRVTWVRGLACVCGCKPPSENAHITSGGMGRKADADQIVPLCPTHHRELHRVGVATFEATHSLYLDLAAAIVARRWHTLTEPPDAPASP